MSTLDVAEKQELVKQARRVERLLARRRRAVKALREVENELREARRFLSALAMPTTEPMNHGEHGELLGDAQ